MSEHRPFGEGRTRGVPLLLSAGWLVLAGSIGAMGCKQRSKTLAPVVMSSQDETQDATQATWAPAWRQAEQARLSNGLLVHWLSEEDQATAKLRLVVPTSARAGELEGAEILVAVMAFELALRRAQAVDAIDGLSVRSRWAPGRVELALSLPVDGLDRGVQRLADALSRLDPALAQEAQGAAIAGQLKLRPESAALASITAKQLGLAPATEGVSLSSLKSLSTDALDRAYARLFDPRRSLLIVHTNEQAQGAPAAGAESSESGFDRLTPLARRWKGAFRLRQPQDDVFARLRPPPPSPPAEALSLKKGRLVAHELPAVGKHPRALALMSLRLELKDSEARATARALQRLLQERVDLRLSLSGEQGLVILALPLPAKDAAKSFDKRLRSFFDTIAEEPSAEALSQSTLRWLGARVVQASLEGEDWTLAWADSLDLSREVEELATAYARDAELMQGLKPAELRSFAQDSLGPKAGWRLDLVGLNETQRESFVAAGYGFAKAG